MIRTLKHIPKPPSYVLTTLRSFPSLEPTSFQPVSADILDLPTRRDLLWSAVVFERDAARVGSRHTLDRSEMGYSGKKLIQQKGSGRARVGDRGSPIRHDGARAFGRKPDFDWSTKLPFQVYSKAIRTALSHQYNEGKLVVVDGQIDFVTGHEKAGKMFMDKLGWSDKKVTVICQEYPENFDKATLNYAKNVDIVTLDAVNVRDLLKPQRLLIESEALKRLSIEYGQRSPIKNKEPL